MSHTSSLEQMQRPVIANILMNTVPSQEGANSITEAWDWESVLVCSVGSGAKSCSQITISIFIRGWQEIFKSKF